MLPSAWVVDSNCFIHMGRYGCDKLQSDMESVLKKISSDLYVTPGVHKEVETVRMQRWEKKPRLLEAIGSLLNTSPIEEDQIRGLANRIGEKASPQDVDLSLMVLASRLSGKGETVILVSDDYKMTTTGEKVHLPYRTCPPSTFFQRLSDLSKGGAKNRLRGISRRIRSEEMRYAISRSGQYDVQAKLTWMIDTLLQNNTPLATVPEKSESTIEQAEMVNTLLRHMSGEKVKKSKLSKVSGLTQPCLEISKMNDVISEIAVEMKAGVSREELYNKLDKISSDSIADFGLAMAPLSVDKTMIAHRAISALMCRLETFLGLMAKSFGDLETTRSHLARGLHFASFIDDDKSEAQALFYLGLVELALNSNKRAASLFEAASKEGKRVDFMRVELNLAAAISRQLANDEETASVHIDTVHRLVEGNEEESIEGLCHLGEALLSIGKPLLALEVFDEALECAVESNSSASAISLADAVARCNAAIMDEDVDKLEKLRSLLDRVNSIGGDAAQKFQGQVNAIEKKRKEQQEPLPETWADWQSLEKLMGSERTLEILRTVNKDDESILIICYHRDLGNLGIWLPKADIKTSENARYRLDAGDTRVKVAHPPEKIREEHNIRGIVAVETPESLTLEVVAEVE